MTIRHAIWRVGPAPEPLQAAVLTREAQLEDMIVAAPSILHDDWMLIGRQIVQGSAAGSICLPSRRTGRWC